MAEQNHNSNNEREREREHSSTWERHSQTIMAGLVLAGILFLYSSVDTSSKALLEMKGDVELVKQSVTYLQLQIKQMGDQQYSKQDALKDQRLFDMRINSIERRVDAIEDTARRQNDNNHK